MSEPTPVKARVHLQIHMSDGSMEELEVPELSLTMLGSGLTARLLDDLRTEGIITKARLDGPKVPGLVLALRGALVEQPDGALYTQRRHVPESDLSDVAGSNVSEEPARGRTT